LLSLTVETLQAEICRIRRFLKGWITLSTNFRREGRPPPTTYSVRKLEWLPFRVVSNTCSALFGFVTNHACDRRTDRITTSKTVLVQLLAQQ